LEELVVDVAPTGPFALMLAPPHLFVELLEPMLEVVDLLLLLAELVFAREGARLSFMLVLYLLAGGLLTSSISAYGRGCHEACPSDRGGVVFVRARDGLAAGNIFQEVMDGRRVVARHGHEC